MGHLIDPGSPLSTFLSANSDDLAFINDGPLFVLSPAPLSRVYPTAAPPAMEVVIELPAAAVAPGVRVAPNDKVLIQNGTPEPEMVPIASCRRRGQLRPRPPKGYREKSVRLTYPNLDSKPTVALVLAKCSKHRYSLRELIGCFERHKAGRDENGKVVAERKCHMHIFGHRCHHSRGDLPNIMTVLAFDIHLDGRMCHPTISPVRNHTEVRYANSNTHHYSNGMSLKGCSGVMSGRQGTMSSTPSLWQVPRW